MKIPPKSFVTRFNDFGRVSFNGKFYQSLLILQAFIFMSRKHSIRFEFIFYSILFLFIAYFANIYFYKTLPSWNFHLENQNYFLWFLRFKFEFRMSSGPTKDEILDVLPKELTDNVVTQKDREKYSHILRKFFYSCDVCPVVCSPILNRKFRTGFFTCKYFRIKCTSCKCWI